MAKKRLYKLVGQNSNVEIEEIDILSSREIAKKDGISMIPAIKIGDNKLSALFLGQEKIEKFLEKNLQENK